MIVDLSHPLTDGIPRFPGDPEVRIAPLPPDGGWQISALAFGSHAGTHLDAPSHRIAGGKAIGDLSVDRFVGPGLLLDASGYGANEALPAALVDRLPATFRPGWFVLLRTGWDRWWGRPDYFAHPYLSPDLAESLARLGVGIVGIDALNVDSTVDGTADAHEALLGRDVLIVENLRGLDALTPGRPYVFAFAPLALGAVDGSPIRALAWDPFLDSGPAGTPRALSIDPRQG